MWASCIHMNDVACLCTTGGTQRLPRVVGIGKAKELIFTAKVLSGQEAAIIGLVEEAVPQNSDSDAAYLKALQIAKEISSKVILCLHATHVCQTSTLFDFRVQLQ